jgi:hypothetical protein
MTREIYHTGGIYICLFFVNVLGALRLLRLAKVRLPVLRSQSSI